MWIYLLVVSFISLFICYEDFKNGLIRNNFIIILFLIFIGYFFININFIVFDFFIHLIWTFFIGFFLYLIDVWSAGDGKFFIVLSLLFPVSIISPKISLDFLINSSVPFFFFYTLLIFKKSGKKEIKKAFKSAFNLYNASLIILIYLGLAWFLTLPLKIMGITVNVFIFIIIFFITIEMVNRIKKINLEFLYVFLAILRIIIDFKNVFTLSFIYQLLIIVFVFIFFRFFILKLGFKLNVKEVDIDKLKPGMEMAEGIIKTDGEYFKKKLFQASFYDFLIQKKEKLIHSKILTKKDIRKISNLKKESKIKFSSILVHTHMPFAIFIFIGFILTILLQGNFINSLFI